MFLTKKTWILGAAMVLLALLNLIPSGGSEAEALPSLPMVATTAVSRLEIARATKDKVILSRDDDGEWVVTAPFEAPADVPGLERLLSLYAEGIPMDALLDEGNLESYGLDFQNGVVVELFTGAEVPAVSFVVGMDTRGGSSFVRLKDEETVYRARVGGRYQYDRAAEDWRERMVVSEDASDVIELAIQQGSAASKDGALWRFQAVDPTMGGGWSLVEDPEFDLDSRSVEAVVKMLATLRAGRILPPDYDGGFDAPLATATLTFSDGEQLSVAVGSRSTERATYVRRSDRDYVYQVAGLVGIRLMQGLEVFRNLNVVAFERTSLLSVRYQDNGVPLTVTQISPGVFAVTDPPNVDVDTRLLQAAIATLADLRADGTIRDDVTSAEAGFDTPSATLTLRFEGGEEAIVEIGNAFPADQSGTRMMYFARRLGDERIFALRDGTWNNVRKGFGRAG